MIRSRPVVPGRLFRLLWCLALLVALHLPAPGDAAAACDPSFLPRTDQGLLQSSALNEASGLAASRRNPGVLWAHNDSGDLPRVFAMNEQAEHLGTYTIAGASNRDWEDIAAGPGPETGRTYLYIGEIGDNNAIYDTKYIYRVPEPRVRPDQAPIDTTLSDAETIAFQYPDGRRDAETLMIDPLTRDLYVVSKREAAVLVYLAPYPQPVGPVITLQHVATLPMTSVTAGDISPSGREILIKTYTQAFYWCRGENQTVAEALAEAPTVVPYTTELQGEAMAWRADGQGYFTTSEEFAGIEAHLYFYSRNPTSTVFEGSVPQAMGFKDPGARPPRVFAAPNPFNKISSLRYVLPRPARVTLRIHAPDGREVRRLVDEWQDAGERAAWWDGRDESGRPLPAGAYYYALQTESGTRPGRIVRVR